MWKKVGHIIGPHGLKGFMLVYIHSGDISWAKDLIYCQLKREKNNRRFISKTFHKKSVNNRGKMVLSSSGNKTKKKINSEFLGRDPEEIVKEVTIKSVESANPYNKGLLIKLEGVFDRTQAELWKGFSFLIPSELLISQPGETIYLSEILNFEVFNEELLVGKVIGFSSNGPQDLLLVETLNDDKNIKTVEIPFVEAFLKKIDFSKRTILMQLPPGLI